MTANIDDTETHKESEVTNNKEILYHVKLQIQLEYHLVTHLPQMH